MKNGANGIDVELLSASSICFPVAHCLPRFVVTLAIISADILPAYILKVAFFFRFS